MLVLTNGENMNEVFGFENIRDQIKTDLDNRKDILLFAFNATGKTRLSCAFNNDEKIENLNYNAIIEDYFSWNNDDKIMMILKGTWLFDFVKDEGLENEISFIFDKFTDEKIESIINFETGEIQFQIRDENGEKNNIKISKGEETLFKWSVFYGALSRVIDILSEKQENRSTNEFDDLKYIIIDDPMSSLDEFKIYTLSVQLLGLMKRVHEKGLCIHFLISTHHVMFYNIIYNTLINRNKGGENRNIFYIMKKGDNTVVLEVLSQKEPLTYHIKSLLEIKKAFDENTIKKINFNMFRSVLEKSCIFLGYSNWQEMFKSYDRLDMFNKLINMNSHEKYAELETEYLTKEQIDEFKNGFEYFIQNFKINI